MLQNRFNLVAVSFVLVSFSIDAHVDLIDPTLHVDIIQMESSERRDRENKSDYEQYKLDRQHEDRLDNFRQLRENHGDEQFHKELWRMDAELSNEYRGCETTSSDWNQANEGWKD